MVAGSIPAAGTTSPSKQLHKYLEKPYKSGYIVGYTSEEIRQNMPEAIKFGGTFGGIFTILKILYPQRYPQMALTDIRIKNAKPSDKVQKLFDGGGLFIAVNPNGSKL